jgi:hypothetical protein
MRKIAARSKVMRSAFARGEQGFRVFTLILALAFALQSFVTQTHIHGVGSVGETSIAKMLKGPAPNPSPLDSSDNACAFCQAIAHSGAFFAPVAPIVLPPSTWTMPALLPVVVSVSFNVLAHSWQSRAPPKA